MSLEKIKSVSQQIQRKINESVESFQQLKYRPFLDVKNSTRYL